MLQQGTAINEPPAPHDHPETDRLEGLGLELPLRWIARGVHDQVLVLVNEAIPYVARQQDAHGERETNELNLATGHVSG